MKVQNQTEIFEKMSISRAVMSLSVPTVISSLVMVIYSLADTWFVGMLNRPVETAAVTLAAPVLLAFNAVNNLFGVGSSSMMGRALGRKDYDTVRRSSSFGFWASVAGGIILSLLCTVLKNPLLRILGADADNVKATADYMFWTVTMGAVPSILNVVLAYLVRTEGASLHAGIGTMSGCILNIILDPIFVLPFGFNMGAAGAGLATFISNTVACIYFFVLLFIKKGKTYVCIKPEMAVPRKNIAMGVFAVGIPAAIQNLLNVTGMTILNNFTSVYGSDAVSAMGIAYKIYMVPMQISWGFSSGVMPLISYSYGSKNYERAKKTVIFTAKVALSFLIVVMAGYFVFSGNLMRLFIKNENIVEYGTHFLRGMCLGLPFIFIDFLGVGTYQSFGKGGLSLFMAVMRKIVLEIPLLILLNRLFPLYGLAYAQSLAEFILSFVAIIIMSRMFHRLLKSNISV